MKKIGWIVGVMMLVPINILAKPTITDWSEAKGYPGLKVRHIYATNKNDLVSLKDQLPYYDKIIEGEKLFDKKETSFTPSEPRPSKYNLIKSENLDFLYEGSMDSVGSYQGLDGNVLNFEPYNDQDSYIIKEFYIPQEYINEVFIDIAQTGGWDEGTGFMMAILEDKEVVYYSDSNKLHEYWSNHLYYNNTRAIFKLKKSMKVSIISYRTDGNTYYERFSVRKIPRDINYSTIIKNSDDRELGDNTLPKVVYDLQLDHPYYDKNNPFYTDFNFNCLVNNELFYNSKLKDLTTYYVENGKVYTKVQTRNFNGDKLKGARGELLGYGTPPLSWTLELTLKQGVPVLQQLIDLVYSIGYSEMERVIILNDANRTWDHNEKNIALVNELAALLKKNNINLVLIGEYNEQLFGPLIEK